ncbi:MAG TPA: hypothetical protein P5081_16450 [Phycisphaerae bacterium]|nr:hypothetical protein [Phycisphaerae bacterium]HRW54462.1 hypothetical protein [Phycisphaerae bacterium]
MSELQPTQIDRGAAARLIECAALVAIASVFALANGVAFGVSNHNQYLLHGLHAMNPDFLAGDWFTCSTSEHHSAFTPLMRLFAMIGPMPLMFALANAVAASVVVFCLHGLARRWFERPLIVTALATFLMVVVPLPYVGMTSLVGLIFQPSTIGAVGLFAGLVLLCLGRTRNAGLVLGLAAIFHINYMVWAVLIVGAVTPLNYRSLRARGALWLLTPLAIATLYHTPFIAASRTSEQLAAAPHAQWILHDLYMPYHSRPCTWNLEAFVQFAAILLAGGVAMAIAGPRRVSRLTRSVAVVLVAIIVAGMLLTTIWQVDLVALLFPYRLIPFLLVSAMLFSAGALVRAAISRDVTPSNFAVLLLTTAAALVAAGVEPYGVITWGTIASIGVSNRLANPTEKRTRGLLVLQSFLIALLFSVGVGRMQLVAAMGAGVVAIAMRWRVGEWIERVVWRGAELRNNALVAMGFVLAMVFVGRVGAQRKDRLGPPPAPADAALYQWCRSTPVGTRFVIPPDLAGFRLNAGRAVVIDWKCMPILPADTLRWYERLVDVAGVRFTSMDQCLAGYRALDIHRARSLCEDYRADYVVTRSRSHVGSLADFPIEFSTPDWRVYRIPAAREERVATGDVRNR